MLAPGFPREALICLTLITDLDLLPALHTQDCYLLADWLCDLVSKDSFTCVIAVWIGLQVTWVTMLVIVQLVQIARGTTTHEAMHGHGHESAVPRAVTAALTTGSVTAEEPLLTQENTTGTPHHGRAPKRDFWTQWKKLLGLDTFMATARSSLNRNTRQRRQNSFHLGIGRNCADFWCDPAPFFGRREPGAGMLDGARINYASLYESPQSWRTLERDQSGSSRIAVEAV